MVKPIKFTMRPTSRNSCSIVPVEEVEREIICEIGVVVENLLVRCEKRVKKIYNTYNTGRTETRHSRWNTFRPCLDLHRVSPRVARNIQLVLNCLVCSRR